MRYATLKILDYRVDGNHAAGTLIADFSTCVQNFSALCCGVYTAGRRRAAAAEPSHSEQYMRSNSMFRQIRIIDYEWTEVGVKGLEQEIWQLALTMNRRHAH